MAPLAASTRLGSGTIHSSLFAATDEARIPDAVATQMAEMFSTDIDFHRELRSGDTFTVVYEALTADGEPITWAPAAGRVLAAEFVNDGKTAIRRCGSEDAKRQGRLLRPRRAAARRALFLASPLEFSRVTSGFAMRLHPILQTWRRHLGVDFGAPTGTPVRAVGDGVVEFAGWQNGYGNVVEIKHGNERETAYAHLSRIDVQAGPAHRTGRAHRRASAPPAGPPGRTCTSSSASRASTTTRCASRAPVRGADARRRSASAVRRRGTRRGAPQLERGAQPLREGTRRDHRRRRDG